MSENAFAVAVVGMAGRFPGAPDLEAYWRNLVSGTESIRRLSNEELAELGVPEEDRRHPAFVPAGALLEGIELFDAGLFGMSPLEAARTDPQQRIFLECAWEALESSGIDPQRFDGLAGVFAGTGANGYLLFHLAGHGLGRRELLQWMITNDKDFVATRVSYKLGLTGPSLDVQTACSTSLVAVHLAFQSLVSYQCDLALAGGVSVQIPSLTGYHHEQGSIFSPDGHCRAFDAQAAGTVFGSGVGAVVLRRLEDALDDGDTIHAVLRGTAINNDGAGKLGFTAPSTEGQAEVIRMAQAVADVEPESISYVEAHGTGTVLGDPIEVAALNRVFGAGRGPRTCALGSAKPNVGHLDTAAGMAGLLKTVLALEHRTLPPTLHFTRPNPEIDFDDGPFFVPTEPLDWQPAPGAPRRAGVSAFGVGGTNAHVIVEEAPEIDPPSPSKPGQLLVLSARSEAALERAAERLAAHLERHPNLEPADVARTLQTGRCSFEHRRAVAFVDATDARRALLEPKRGTRGTPPDAAPRLAFLFPGQGSQHPNMGKDLYDRLVVFRREVDRAAEILRQPLGEDVRDLLFPPTGSTAGADRLIRTRFAQPALFVVEWALARSWTETGIEPDALLGHSVGEWVAATLAGVFRLEDALALVAERGRLMEERPEGAMAAVALPAEELERRLGDHPDLSLAAVNAPTSCVVSGPAPAVAALCGELAAEGVSVRRLHTSHAFHSPTMDAAAQTLVRRVAEVPRQAPRIPFVSNLTGTWITDEEATDPAYWGRQLRQPVRFSDGVRRLLEEPGRVFLEVGSGHALTTLVRKHRIESRPPEAWASWPAPDDPEGSSSLRWLETLGTLWTRGLEPSWDALYEGERRLRLPLPGYPFERRRYWIEPAEGTDRATGEMGAPQVPRFDRPEETSAWTPPEGPLERELAELWQNLLGLDRVGADDDFFELGGDSLLGTRVATRLRERHGVELPLAELFTASTVRGLARRVEAARQQTANDPLEPVPREGVLRASFAQERMWFLHRMDPTDSRYHLPAAVDLRGRLRLAALRQAMATVVARHEALRTRFAVDDGAPVQRIDAAPDRPLAIPIADLEGLSTGDRMAEARRLEQAEARRPFDLAGGPGRRIRMLRHGETSHTLCLTLHHAISDGWSTGLLVREVASLVRSAGEGGPGRLPDLPVQYADFAAWQRRHLGAAYGERLMAYWRQRLEGAPELTELPTDHPRSRAGDARGLRIPLRVPAVATQRLQALAESAGATVYQVLLTAVASLLHRLTGQRDLVLGSPVAGRVRPEVEPLVGLFVNTLALRLDLGGDAAGGPTFRQLVERTRDAVLEDLEHQEMPFERLVAELVTRRDPAVTPLFQVLLTFQDDPASTISLPDLEVTPREVHDGSARFDLTVFLTSDPHGLRGYLEVRRDLFDATTGRRLAHRWLRWLDVAVSRADEPVDELPLLSEPERHQMLREWDGPGRPAAAGLLHEPFFVRADRTPDAVAVVDGDREIPYGELAARTRALAARLRSHGVGPETVVGLYTGRRAEAVVGIYGILAAGGAYLPLDPDYPPERVAYALSDAGARWVVTTPELAPAVPEAHRPVILEPGTDDPGTAPAGAVVSGLDPDQAAYVIYTSGSTGRPKGVVVTHANASRLFTATSRRYRFGPGDVWPLFHSTAFDVSVWEIQGALLHGGRLVTVPYWTSRSPKDLLQLLADTGTTVLNQTPTAFLQLQEAALADHAPPLRVRWVVFAGEVLEPAALGPWIERFGDGTDGRGPKLVNMYGITETTVHVTWRRIVQADVDAATSPVGRPMDDLRIRLLDPRGRQPSPMGVAGEIFVGGPGLARGYLNRPALTAERFVPDPWGPPGDRLYRSGDLARHRSDGDLEYLGRLDHQVQLRGFRVELGEIEAMLASHPSVATAAVVPAGSGSVVERLAAWIRAVDDPQAESIDPVVLRAWLTDRLPSYMVPSLLFVRSDLPETPSGKIDRRALIEASRDAGPEAMPAAAHVPPTTPTAEALAVLWREILEVDRVGMTDDFFGLGGHSLLAVRLLDRVEHEMGVELPLQRLFEVPTLAEMERAVTEAQLAEALEAEDEELLTLLGRPEEVAT